MKTAFLFGTMNRLLLWDGEEFRTVHEGWGKYVGITWNERHVYAVARGAPGAEAILVLDGNLEHVETLHIPDLKGTNYIGWFGGKLYITNTGRERLEIWDGKETRSHNWTGYDRDANHLNSVWSNGENIYVTEGGRSGNRARIFDLDMEQVRVEENLGESIHCVYREGGRLYTVSSRGQSVNIRDLETGETRRVPYSPYHRGYGEGLCRLEGQWYIGVSRDSPDQSAVLAFADDWEFVEKLLLPDDIGQLYEVRAVTGRDRAHNSLPFPGKILGKDKIT